MLKKIFSLLLIVSVFFVLIQAAPSAAAGGDAGLTIELDGESIYSDVAAFIDANGRTMAPVRSICEALDAEVGWDETTLLVTVSKDSDVIQMIIGDNLIVKNGKAVEMDTTAIIKDSRTFIPVRYIAEALGLLVGWDDASQTVILTSADSSGAAEIQDDAKVLSDMEKHVLELATGVMGMLKNEDWGAIGHMTHPESGLTFSPYGYIDSESAIRLGIGDVIALEMDETIRTWGYYDGSGEPITCAFSEYYDRFIYNRDFVNAPEVAVNNIIRTTFMNNLNIFGDDSIFVEFYMPGGAVGGIDDPDIAEFNWASLRLVFAPYKGDEYYEKDYYLVAIVHDEWTI